MPAWCSYLQQPALAEEFAKDFANLSALFVEHPAFGIET